MPSPVSAFVCWSWTMRRPQGIGSLTCFADPASADHRGGEWGSVPSRRSRASGRIWCFWMCRCPSSMASGSSSRWAQAMPFTVFVTAYDQHAIRAFEANALDYLLKPFSDAPEAAMVRARQRLIERSVYEFGERMQRLAARSALRRAARSARRAVRRDDALRRVADIDWIEAAGVYVNLHVAGKNCCIARRSRSRGAARPQAFRACASLADRQHRQHRPARGNRSHGEFDAMLKPGSRMRISRTYRATSRNGWVNRCSCRAGPGVSYVNVKTYHDIVGDGGSRVLEQVAEQRARIADGLAGVRHLVAIGSGKGGVGKSTLTLQLAGALRARGHGWRSSTPTSTARRRRASPVSGARRSCPGSRRSRCRGPRRDRRLLDGLAGPGVGGARLRERGRTASRTCGARRGSSRSSASSSPSFAWGELDLLLVDLPPGAERTFQYAEFLGAADVVRARHDPVATSRAASSRARSPRCEEAESRPRLRREHERLLLPRLRRRQAAVRRDDDRIGLGHPASGACRSTPSSRGLRSRDPARGPARDTRRPGPRARRAAASGQPRARSIPMKFLCVPATAR